MDNSAEVRKAPEQATARAIDIVGGKVVRWAHGLVPVDTGALRSSITHRAVSVSSMNPKNTAS